MQHLTLAVIGLAAAVAQEFIPIGGGSGSRQGGFSQGISPAFGEPFTPTIINPNDPSFQPANLPGNRPNPIPVFPKSRQAGTPHEAPVDFTFIHQHSYKEPFRSDQTVTSFINPIGAARPNIPRTLGRENIYIDPRADPNSPLSRAEAEKKAKNMIFYGLAPPVEKLHREDEFAPSTVPLRSRWDQWYDRFEEAPADPRKQFLLTQTKRPNIVDIPFYAADRGKRQVTDAPVVDSDELTTTTTLSPISDAMGSTTEFAALEATTEAAAARINTTITAVAAGATATAAPDVAGSVDATPTTAAPTNTTSIAPITSTTTPVALAPLNLTAPANATAPVVASSINGTVLTAPTTAGPNDTKPTASSTVPSTGPSIPIRPHPRRQQTTTAKPATVAQRNRSTSEKVPLRTTVSVLEKTTASPTTKNALQPLKLDTAVGSARNATRLATKLPLRNTTFPRRPPGLVRLPLRRLLNVTSTAAPRTSAASSVSPSLSASSSSSATPATTTPTTPATAVIKSLKTLQRPNVNSTTNSTLGTTVTTPATSVIKSLRALQRSNVTSKTTTKTTLGTTTPATTVIKRLRALQRSNNATTTRANTTISTTARTKGPFRIFSTRPLNASKLPSRTPIVEEKKPSALALNSVEELRTEVNRLLTNVVQLQSTVIAQQQRIALLENQLRLRRSLKPGSRKTTRFIAPSGRTVERTVVDIRKGRSAKLINRVSQGNLRQRSSLA